MSIYNMLAGQPLKPWFSVRIEKEGESKHVYFQSDIHINKEVKLTFCFSDSFTDYEILKDRDVISKFIQMYGV